MAGFQLAGAIAGFVAVVLSVLLNLRQLLALFARGQCLITSSYHGSKDLVGSSSKPRFLLQFENRGPIPMDFRHFELLLPRLEGIVDKDDFVFHPGAELFKDGCSLGSRLKALQEYRKIDFITRSVHVAPQSSEVEFFELDAFLPEPPPEGWNIDVTLPSDFKPVLQFRHAAGQEFHCDQQGVHPGPYEWPYADSLRGATKVTAAKVIELTRGRVLRRWSAVQRDADT